MPTLDAGQPALDAPGEQEEQRGGDDVSRESGREGLDFPRDDPPGDEGATLEDGHKEQLGISDHCGSLACLDQLE